MPVLSRRRARFHKVRKDNVLDSHFLPPEALCCGGPVVNGFGRMVANPDRTWVFEFCLAGRSSDLALQRCNAHISIRRMNAQGCPSRIQMSPQVMP
jgi:hypothetical protein